MPLRVVLPEEPAANLAQNAHAEIFQIPAGAQVIAGQVQILTEDAGGGLINIGVGGTGTELMNSQAISAKTAVKVKLGCYAGHGIHYDNVADVAAITEIEELNVGHSIVGRAIFVGMERAVREMAELAQKARQAAINERR